MQARESELHLWGRKYQNTLAHTHLKTMTLLEPSVPSLKKMFRRLSLPLSARTVVAQALTAAFVAYDIVCAIWKIKLLSALFFAFFSHCNER